MPETKRAVGEGIEMTRWVVRMAHDRKLLTPKQFEFSALQLNECRRMVGGWLRSYGGGQRRARGLLLKWQRKCLGMEG